MTKKHLIITGAYGLVGSNICARLSTNKYLKVTKIKFNEIPKDCEMADYIIHGAGYGQPQMFTKDKIATLAVNTTTTIDLFKFLKPDGKFLYISTSEVYSGAKPLHNEDMIGTTTPQHPRACYIEGKRCGEAICMAYREAGYDVKIARLALAYGPGTKAGDTRVLNQFIEKALVKRDIELMDKGEAVRTYCYIDDAVDMILEILYRGTQPVYNVGGQSTITIAGLAKMIAGLTGSYFTLGKESIRGSPDSVHLDMSRTLFEFPREFISMEEGLKRTIEYQKTLYGK